MPHRQPRPRLGPSVPGSVWKRQVPSLLTVLRKGPGPTLGSSRGEEVRPGRGKCKAGGQQAGCQGWPGSSWGVDHRGLERIVGVKAQAWQRSVGTACPSIGPGNRRGGAEGGPPGLLLSGFRLCRAEPPGLACHPHWESEFTPYTLVAPGSFFSVFGEPEPQGRPSQSQG